MCRNPMRLLVTLGVAVCLILMSAAASDDTATRPKTTTGPAKAAEQENASAAGAQAANVPAEAAPARGPIEMLLEEIEELEEEIEVLRREHARARLEASEAHRELAELRQFILDHHEFGEDYQQYKAIKEIAEREAQHRRAEEARQRREAERAVRREQYEAAQAAREQRRSDQQHKMRYRKAGFSHLGLDVYAGKMGYHYRSRDSARTRVDYEPGLGNYLRIYPSDREIDFSSMTISGSVLNAAEEVRNIGVAVAFFDESGNQIGHEIVQVKNARPDVPYPFTSTIEMALNRPFDSSSVYVLYADPAAAEE